MLENILNRFQSVEIEIPTNFTLLYDWLLKCASAKYGDHLISALEIIKENQAIDKNLWLLSIEYGRNGSRLNLTNFEKMKIVSALRDWAIETTGRFYKSTYFQERFENSLYKERADQS